MTSLQKSSCIGTLIIFIATVSGCSSSSNPSTAGSGSSSGPPQTIKGIAVPRNVAVVTATNAN
ncbi:MAG TPA: hypothetical protein VKT22_09705 [Steroidobacteraceae bacterium]|nr:hypothetical protein [Steroidobacteraceae bacterium]